MALQPGTRLGVYDVLSAIGKCGMSEVWKARYTEGGQPEARTAVGSLLARVELCQTKSKSS